MKENCWVKTKMFSFAQTYAEPSPLLLGALLTTPSDEAWAETVVDEVLAKLMIQFKTWDELVLAAQPAEIGHAYGRNVIFRNDQVEIMLARWAKGATCAPHDHGKSAGCVRFLRGRFVETQFELQKGLNPKIKSVQDIKPMTTVLVQKGEIHSCQSLDEGISLHVYTPAISAMKVYDFERKIALTVTDDCGAWITSNPAEIVSTQILE